MQVAGQGPPKDPQLGEIGEERAAEVAQAPVGVDLGQDQPGKESDGNWDAQLESRAPDVGEDCHVGKECDDDRITELREEDLWLGQSAGTVGSPMLLVALHRLQEVRTGEWKEGRKLRTSSPLAKYLRERSRTNKRGRGSQVHTLRPSMQAWYVYIVPRYVCMNCPVGRGVIGQNATNLCSDHAS